MKTLRLWRWKIETLASMQAILNERHSWPKDSKRPCGNWMYCSKSSHSHNETAPVFEGQGNKATQCKQQQLKTENVSPTALLNTVCSLQCSCILWHQFFLYMKRSLCQREMTNNLHRKAGSGGQWTCCDGRDTESSGNKSLCHCACHETPDTLIGLCAHF